MDVNRYVYDKKRGLPICTKNPQKLSKLEKQRLKEREEASREEIATKTKSDASTSEKSTSARVPNSARRSKRAVASTPRQPTSTRLQQNMLKEDVVDVSSSDDDSDDDRAPAFATDEQILKSYYEVTAANPRKDGKIPWIKITNDLKRKNLRPQTKHKMTKLVNSHAAVNTPVRKTRPKRDAPALASDSESEGDSADEAPTAPAESTLLIKKMYEEMMAMTRTMQESNIKHERAIKETNDRLAKKIEEGMFSFYITIFIILFLVAKAKATPFVVKEPKQHAAKETWEDEQCDAATKSDKQSKSSSRRRKRRYYQKSRQFEVNDSDEDEYGEEDDKRESDDMMTRRKTLRMVRMGDRMMVAEMRAVTAQG